MRKLVRFFRGDEQTCWHSPSSIVSISSRTVLTVLMFVTMGLGSAFAQDDCQPDFTIECPPAAVISCSDLDDPTVSGIPTIVGNTCDLLVDISSTDVVLEGDDCSESIVRVWVASVGDYVVSCSQMITSLDNVGPVFDAVPAAVTIQCSDDVPAQSMLTASDECGSVAEIVGFTSTTSVGDDSFAGSRTRCTLTTPIGPGPDGSIWLNNVFAQGLAASNHWSWTGNPTLEEYPDGTAHLVGTVANNSNASQQWLVDMWFQGRKNWNQWSALGRLYKDDLGFGILNNNYLSWSYYELVPTFSTLTGAGAYAGNILYLTHQPESFLFGFQKGVGANSRNGNDGMSGWFYWEGWYNGQWREGNGDLFTNNTCTNLDEPCAETTTYVWRAQDGCGNNTFASQEITVVDTIAPTFDNCPMSVTIECGLDSIPPVAAPTATDNCSEDVSVVYLGETSTTDGPCYTMLTRTWVAEDECQNRTVCTQTITILDTTAPNFDSVPESYTVECSDDIVRDEATASDACDLDVTITVTETEVEGECPQERVITRLFVAEDDCENTVEYTQTITVVDTTAPAFDEFDPYVSAECDALDEVPAPTASDLCGAVTVELTNELLNSGGCLGVLERTYTATDECGNSSTAVLYISILDNTPPTINNPEDMTVECDEVPSLPEISITDNCENEVTFTTEVVEQEGECENSYTILWIWTATDLCENVSVDTTVITVQDTTDPTFDELYDDVTFSCDETLPEVVLPTASDNCDTDVTVSHTDLRIDGSCPEEYQIQRTFRAFDNCGNSAMFVQIISVVDNDAPVFDEQPSFYTYECSDSIPTITPFVSDLCSEFSLVFSDSVAFVSDCQGVTYRTWTATDACGNSSEFVQTFQSEDTTDPIIVWNFEEELPCDDYDVVLATVSDNCDEDITLTYTDILVSGGACQGRLIRTYTATDECGNTATAEQFITLIDNVDPELEEATADATFECGIDEYSTPVAVFSDNCDDELDVDMVMASSTDGCVTTITYTFTAEDNCENTATHTVTYTIVDTTDPVVTAPAGGQFSCDEEVIYGEGSASDECDMDLDIVITNDTIAGNCAGNYTIVRTWTVTDNCGNVGVGTANYYIFDNDGPEFDEVPADVTIECDQPWPTALPVVSDVCGTASVTASFEVIEGNCENSYTVIRTFTATDDCGNTSTEEQIVTVVDTTDPEIEANFEEELPCDDYDVVLATATDNCDDNVSITYSDILVSGGACQGRIIRTYTATDNCGNTSTFEQFITLIDNVDPELEEATADATFECGIDEYSTPVAVFSDNCDDELDVDMVMASSTDGCVTTITYTFTAEDNCENTATHTVTYTIVDTTDPMISAPAGGQFSCDEEIVYGNPTASDACDMDLSIVWSNDTIPGSCPNNYTVVRTWTATDNCGNSASTSASYVVFDNTNPTFDSDLVDVYLECFPVDYEPVTVTASDNCGSASVVSSVSTDIDDCGNGVLVVSYTATDLCGNQSFDSYIVHILDETAPVLVGTPADIALECGDEIPEAPVVTAEDNCDSMVEVVYTETVLGENPLEEGQVANCEILTPQLPANDPCNYEEEDYNNSWAMALFSMPSAHKFYHIVSGNFVQYEDGTIHVIAQVENNHPDYAGSGFFVDVNFGMGMNWADWSTQSFMTGFKADCGGVAANRFDWTYFLLVPGAQAELVGYGAYQGSALNLVHAPSNNYFGFQLGSGANNYNDAENGFGGWFTYSGAFFVNGSQVMSGNAAGAGDFAFELDCCPDYTIERCWTAVDCSGNEVSYCQTITVDGGAEEAMPVSPFAPETANVQKGSLEIVNIFPNPANERAQVKFVSETQNTVMLDIVDLTGRKVAQIFNGQVDAGVVYNFDVNTREFGNGLYQVRLMSLTEVEMKQLSIVK